MSEEKKYRIHSIDECGNDVWWSNEEGWVTEGYTLFTRGEKESFLYLPKNFTHSNWQTIEERKL